MNFIKGQIFLFLILVSSVVYAKTHYLLLDVNGKKLDNYYLFYNDTRYAHEIIRKFKFISSCDYHCEGEIVEVPEPIDPFEAPKAFLYPRPNPINGTEIACRPNPFEDRQPSGEKKSESKPIKKGQ